MKLLLENWKKYLNEEQEEVEEGLGTKLAMGGALVGATGMGAPAYAGDTDTTQGTATTQQADVKVITNTLQPALDEDGNERPGWVSITVPIGAGIPKSMLQTVGGSLARGALVRALGAQGPTGVYQGELVGAQISWKDKDGKATSPFAGDAMYATAAGALK